MEHKKRVISFLACRQFTPRSAKNTLDPIYVSKTKFDYSDIQQIPGEDEVERVYYTGDVCLRNDYMYNHYQKQLGFWQTEGNVEKGYLGYIGYYGPYWMAHFGLHHHFLKRRTLKHKDSTYGTGNPLKRWYIRKCDERGVDWFYPYGQNYHMVLKWMMLGYIVKQLYKLFATQKEHRRSNNPTSAKEPWTPKLNMPFFLYSMENIVPPGGL